MGKLLILIRLRIHRSPSIVSDLENSEDWMNPVQHAHLVVKQARAFFDSWLERFSTWDEFRQVCETKDLPEFGSSANVDQIEGWFGGGDSENNYSNMYKYGVGAPPNPSPHMNAH